jgi:hypothetical protein
LYISRTTVVVIIFNVTNIGEKGVQKKMTRGQILPVAFLSVLMNLILFSNIHSSLSQHSYANPQEEAIRTLEIEVNLNNPVVGHGKEQIINFQVTDQKSGKPISGAITSATVSYADGKTTRQFSVPTDALGRSSISWTIESDAPNGLYEVLYSVHQTGYVSESFAGSFTLGVQNVHYDCSYSSYLCRPTGGGDVDYDCSYSSYLCRPTGESDVASIP